MRKLILFIALLCSISAGAQGVKISALPQAGSLTGSEITAIVQSGVTKKTTVQSIANLGGGASSFNGDSVLKYAWGLTGNSGTNPSTNFIGTIDAQDFVTKTYNTERYRIDTNGFWTFNQTTPFILGQNQMGIVNDINLPASGTSAVTFNGGAPTGYVLQSYSESDSFNTLFNHDNIEIDEQINSKSTGLGVEHYMDSTSAIDLLHYGRLRFQQGVFDNLGTKTNMTTELNIYDTLQKRDITYFGGHYGHFEYFVSDTLSGSSSFPQGRGIFALDSVVLATHVTDTVAKENITKFATKFRQDTAFSFMFDSIGTPVISAHRNGLQIADGSQGAGKVLTSDANGLASWTGTAFTQSDSATIYALTPAAGTTFTCTNCSGSGITGRVVYYMGGAWRRVSISLTIN